MFIKQYSLSQNYPNLFNPTTKIKFQQPNEAFVKLIVIDVLGREVAVPVDEQLKPGTYEIDWNGTNYSSGIYFYKLIVCQDRSSTGYYVETKKMVLIK